MLSKDSRLFKRYPKETNIELLFNRQILSAKTVDYSLDGIGAFVEIPPMFAKDDLLDIAVMDPEIISAGTVVWSRRQDQSGLRLGIKNTGCLKGRLRDFRLPDTLIGLQRGLKTGVLTVHRGEIVKEVYIRNGDMIFSSSNQAEDRLGDMLLREGKITGEQYAHSLDEMQRTAERHGTLLVKLGYLKPQDLVTEVRHQVEEIIMSLFMFEDGRFEFAETSLPADEVITLKLSAANLIYYGTKRANDLGRRRRDLLSPDNVPCFSSNPLDLFQDIRLDDSAKKILSCIDGKTAIREIIALTHLGDDETLGTIHSLSSIRMIEIVDSRAAGVSLAEETKDAVEAFSPTETRPEIDPAVSAMIEDTHRRHKDIGYYGILGLKDYASSEEIKTAYYRTARKFHPDMHFHLADDSTKEKLGDIFAFVYDAYSTLSNSQKRREYDTSLIRRPAGPAANPSKARAAFVEGKDLLRKKRYSEAEILFGQAAYFDASMAEHHFQYGVTLARQRKFKAAEKALRKALELDLSNATYNTELGFIYLALGFPRRARGLFEKALKISPGHTQAAEGLGKAKSAG